MENFYIIITNYIIESILCIISLYILNALLKIIKILQKSIYFSSNLVYHRDDLFENYTNLL